MNKSPTLYLTIGILMGMLLATGVALAQTKDYEATPQRAYDTGHCMEYRVKMLYLATEPGELQTQYLQAAEAYRQLDLEGQLC